MGQRMLTIGDTSVDKSECLAVAEGSIIKDIKLVTVTMLVFIHCSPTKVI
jgi:hypothetical protein